MDPLISQFVLLIVILVCFNFMVGGRSSNIIGPVIGMASSLVRTVIGLCIRLVTGTIGTILSHSASAAVNATRSHSVHRLPTQRRRPIE